MNRRLLLLVTSVVAALLLTGCAMHVAFAAHARTAADRPIFDDALSPGFQDWSFNAAVDFDASTPTYGGSTNAIGVGYDAGNWGALWLVHPGSDIDLHEYTAIRFAIHGGTVGGQQLTVRAGAGASFPAASAVDLELLLPGRPVAGEWRVVTVTLDALGLAGGSLGSIAFQSNLNSGQPVFYIDDLRLIGGEAPPPPTGQNAMIRIQAGGPITPVDPRILGSNLPAWLNPNGLSDPIFRARTAASGISVLRMPGGSWSNGYGWLSCELGADQPGAFPCYWTWAARPTDFVDFLNATGVQGMWIVNPNATAKEAAAAVAFFNGELTDTRTIGVDIRGTDWYTVGHWAQLRAAGGNVEPVGIKLWEVGNEVYGGKPSEGGADCLAWGWEDVWTCDGAEYVNGKGSGASRNEGYLEFRTAMRAVDPTILVGAVGFENPGDPTAPDWSNFNNWGIEVMAAAGSALDFYSIHPYAYFELPPANATGFAEILAKPQSHWREIRSALDSAFDAHAGGRRAPIAATEFNLVSVQEQDNAQLMTRAVNALFLADSIGQAIQYGYAMLNQWDLANGAASNGTEYGLMHVGNGYFRAPQYYVFPLWARIGATMLPVTTTLDSATQAGIYAGRVNSQTLSILAINKTGMPFTVTIDAPGIGAITGGEAYEVRASSASAQAVSYNGSSTPSDALTEPPAPVAAVGGAAHYVLPPWAITLLHLSLEEGTSPPQYQIHLPVVQD